MKIRCNSCGAVSSLDALIESTNNNNAIKAALDVPPAIKSLVISYVALFRAKNRDLTPSRWAKLVNEITPAMNSGKVSFNKQQYDMGLDAWAWAISQVIEAEQKGTLSRPLSNHNYLKTILISYDHRKHKGSKTIASQFTDGLMANTTQRSERCNFNGVWCNPLPNHTKEETIQRVNEAQGAGETTDETYKRLLNNM